MLPIHKAPPETYDYDDIPTGYYFKAMQEGSFIQRFWHQKTFEEIASKINPKEKALDFGCGPGSFLWMLNQMHPNIHFTGIDIAGAQLRFARNMRKESSSITFVGLAENNTHFPFDNDRND